ncbi:MAG TPA: M23 family metallopeptidase [Candidatus Eisenbacteria bacterium]|nr:M23 family metallopeptidase [Candidatus Eisenbacteria bacterium]
MTARAALRVTLLVGWSLTGLPVEGRCDDAPRADSAAVAAGRPAAAAPARPSIAAPPRFLPRLPQAPLRGRLVLNGGFGDFRGGHFHAGFDFATSQRVGRAVHAPARGWVERVRSSGVGYGRALYVRTPDGRLLEFGHLDAFAGPVAAYVDSAKAAKGEYEQDLWPARGRFAVEAGAVIAWTGESGAGGPHLHAEVRRGDVAYHPVRAGLALGDAVAPTLVDLTLEPLDDASTVEGNAGPVAVGLARRDTIAVVGRVRAVVRAYDRVAAGGARIAPWTVSIEWNGRRTACVFDSVSWATDMPEAEYVYDTGRVSGGRGFVLWAPATFRPSVLRADAPAGEEAGTIEVRPGDPPRALRIEARDAAGRKALRTVVLRPGKAPAAPVATWWRGDESWRDETLDVASLPGGFLRVSLLAAAPASGVEFQLGASARRGARRGARWTATLAAPPEAASRSIRLPIAVRSTESSTPAIDRAGVVWARRVTATAASTLADSARTLRVDLAAGASFEDALLFAFAVPATAQAGLAPLGTAWRVEPATLPLRRAARISLVSPTGAPRERVGLYRLDGARWQWVGGMADSAAQSIRGDSRRLGTFALLRDDLPPRIRLKPTPVAATAGGPYSRWAVEVSVADAESGVDGSKSYVEVDGRRVPSEWDPEAGVLRWRPLAPPAPGSHVVGVVATDRAGNTTRETGSVATADKPAAPR